MYGSAAIRSPIMEPQCSVRRLEHLELISCSQNGNPSGQILYSVHAAAFYRCRKRGKKATSTSTSSNVRASCLFWACPGITDDPEWVPGRVRATCSVA